MSEARARLDWPEQIRLAMDPRKAKKLRERALPGDEEVCTMCGEFCAVKVYAEGCVNEEK